MSRQVLAPVIPPTAARPAGRRGGDRLTLTAESGMVLARRDPGGMVTLPDRPRVAIPAFVKVTTNSLGQFSATFADPVTAIWAAYYDGNSSHVSVQSGNVSVTVRVTPGPDRT